MADVSGSARPPPRARLARRAARGIGTEAIDGLRRNRDQPAGGDHGSGALDVSPPVHGGRSLHAHSCRPNSTLAGVWRVKLCMDSTFLVERAAAPQNVDCIFLQTPSIIKATFCTLLAYFYK